MNKYFLITNVSDVKYWSRLVSEFDTACPFQLKAIKKHGNIYVNRNGGYFTKDFIKTIHKTVESDNFPAE